MKKPARKKTPNEEKVVSQIVSEIVEENETEQNDKVVDIPDEAKLPEMEDPVTDEQEKEEVKSGEIKHDDEATTRASFYEKVMGDKPPERRDEVKEEEKERSINTKLFLLGAFVFVLTILISSLVGLSILNKDILVSKLGQKVTATPQQVPPTPTPVAITRNEWTFEVLNGSNTPGLAAKGAEKIKALGYAVGKVGNADDSVDISQILFSKDATDDQKKHILEDLKKDFGDLTVSDTIPDLKKTVRIILAN